MENNMNTQVTRNKKVKKENGAHTTAVSSPGSDRSPDYGVWVVYASLSICKTPLHTVNEWMWKRKSCLSSAMKAVTIL